MKDELARRVESRLAEEGVEIVLTQVIQSGPDWRRVDDIG